ncbi:hypothetical protein V2W30_39875 (plasmid) [Streptomyces sp. Q6]|uniref:Uncharacterized protein n=1 Tax=Streptomyces citrinus TaxID=3118173 RepID=A0ACD5AQX3_9ACTN
MSSKTLLPGGAYCRPDARLSPGDAAVVVVIIVVAAVMIRDGMILPDLLVLLGSVGLMAMLTIRLSTMEFRPLRRAGKALLTPAQL